MGHIHHSATGKTLVAGSNASAMRSTLGLGTIATQDANNVSITGGSISGVSISGLIVDAPQSSQTSDFNASVGNMYPVDASGGAVTGTLPALASQTAGQRVAFYNSGASASPTIQGNGGTENIWVNGANATSYSLAVGETIVLVVNSDKSKWIFE